MARMAEQYAPITKKATWPNEKIPANPMITSQLDATTAQITHMINIFIIKGTSPTKMGKMARTP